MSWKTTAAAVAIVLTVGWYAWYEYAASLFLHLTPQTQRWCDMAQVQGIGIERLEWPYCGASGQALEDRPETCGTSCYEKSFLIVMRDFEAAHANGVKVLGYPSRPFVGESGQLDDANLTGWWLPAPETFPNAPRVVVQHGLNENAYTWQRRGVHYQLRYQGFGILVNNFRDHCDPDYRKAVVQWGHAYPYDVLGAWDYAVNDTDDELGGARPANRVGILGFSMGGFAVASAFGLEKEIPAAWTDSVVKSPWDAFSFIPRRVFTGWLGLTPPDWLLLRPTYDAMRCEAKWRHGVDLEEHLPMDLLPGGPDTRRPMHFVANKNDLIVPWQASEDLVKLLEAYPDKYDVTNRYYEEDDCKIGQNHGNDILRDPEGYSEDLCHFWKKAFGLPHDYCNRTAAESLGG